MIKTYWRLGRVQRVFACLQIKEREETMAVPDDILKPALALKQHKEIDELWAGEAESRIDAFEKGRIMAITLEKILEKYKQREP